VREQDRSRIRATMFDDVVRGADPTLRVWVRDMDGLIHRQTIVACAGAMRVA